MTQYVSAIADHPDSLAYLANRGIHLEPELPDDYGNPWRLGVVDEPACPEHEPFVGWIAIPFLVPDLERPVGMKFRRPPGNEGKAKYMSHPGTGQRLFGVCNFQADSDIIGITEGEFDAIVATECGIPSVAVPGANSWKPNEWGYLFEGYSRVVVFGDGDNPGRAFADQIAGQLSNARAIRMPDGHDVSSLVKEQGGEAFRDRAGV